MKWFKVILGVSIVALLYFVGLSCLSKVEIQNETLLGVIRFVGEMFTIPLLVFVPICLLYSLFMVVKGENRSRFAVVLFLNIVTAIVLAWMNFFEA